ncbi:MAG: hypothetical protein HFJ35_02775 [Clostridia bacterium]|nr:hypothetical protein [Clostridia bacterium]
MSEKVLAIRIDDELQKEVKIHLAKNGISLKDYITNLIQDDLAKVKRRENANK